MEDVDHLVPGLTGGLLATTLALTAAVAPGILLLLAEPRLHFLPYAILSAILLKLTFSLKSLEDIVTEAASQDPETRRETADQLVTRDAHQLDEGHLNSALLETLSENTTDSLFTPLFYYAVAGLPGALAYRALDVLDSTIGYPEKGLKGATPARLEDLVSLIPSYLVLLPLAASAETLDRGAAADGLRASRRYGDRRAGFNGKVMAFYAGALHVTLEKPGHYTMGNGPMPGEGELRKGRRLLRRTALATAALLLALLSIFEVLT